MMAKLTALPVVALALLAQDQPIQVSTRLIQINVVVRDKNGPVTGLTKDDFEIVDQGKPRPIAAFSATDARTSIAKTKPLAPNVFSNRMEQHGVAWNAANLVLIDTLNTPFSDQARAKAEIFKFLRLLEPHENVAIYSLGNQIRILQDFTSDQDLLFRALAKFKGEVHHESLASSPEPVPETGDPTVDQFLSGSSEIVSDFYRAERRQKTIEAFQAIANHLARVPGRKNLIWISAGFPLAITGDSAAGANSSAARYSSDLVPYAARLLTSANIAIYPVDPRGLMTAPPPPLSRGALENQGIQTAKSPDMYVPEGIDAMESLASRTGGRAFYNTNDIRTALRTAVSDGEYTYTLGFYVGSSELDGKFHTLKVHASRKGADVRHRTGYFAVDDPTPTLVQMRDRIAEAIGSPLDSMGVGFAARIDPAQDGEYTLTLAVETRNLRFAQQNGEWAGKTFLTVVQQGLDGKILNTALKTIDVKLKETELKAAGQQGLRMTLGVKPVAGLKSLRILVADPASGSIGSLRIPL